MMELAKRKAEEKTKLTLIDTISKDLGYEKVIGFLQLKNDPNFGCIL